MDETTTQSRTATDELAAAVAAAEPGDTLRVTYTAASTVTEQTVEGEVVETDEWRDERLDRTTYTVELETDDNTLRVTATDEFDDQDPTVHSVRYNWSNGERVGERGTHRVSTRGGVHTVELEDDDETEVATDGGVDVETSEVSRDSHAARDAFDALEVGDQVRLAVDDLVDDLVDGPYRVTHTGEVVVGLDTEGQEENTLALVETVDGDVAFVGPHGTIDVETLEILDDDDVETDGGQDPLADVDLPLVPGATHAVEITGVDDGSLVLEGDTYQAKEAIKMVSYGARDWDADRKVWLVDTRAAEDLADHLADAGFDLVDARPDDEDDEDGDEDLERLEGLAETLQEGDRIRVEYAQKNGEGKNEKVGTVRNASLGDDEYPPIVVFVRDDGQTMRIKLDDRGDLSLFTGGYAPYVGDVGVVEIRD